MLNLRCHLSPGLDMEQLNSHAEGHCRRIANVRKGARGTDGSRSANVRSDNLAFNQCCVYDRRGPGARH
jgi:hypothetical protein